MRGTPAVLAGCLVLAPMAGAAQVQTAGPPALRAHQVTLSGGLVWSGGYSIGDATARLRGNAVGAAAPPFTLFATSSSIESTAGVEGRVGVALTRSFAIEAGGSYARPSIAVSVTEDTESAASRFSSETLQQWVFDAGAVWQFPMRKGTRFGPFVSGGAGYLRQLHDERTRVETGQIYYAGGGVRYWIRGGTGTTRSIGLRGDVRATWRRQGVDFEDKTRAYPTLSVLLFAGL